MSYPVRDPVKEDEDKDGEEDEDGDEDEVEDDVSESPSRKAAILSRSCEVWEDRNSGSLGLSNTKTNFIYPCHLFFNLKSRTISN